MATRFLTELPAKRTCDCGGCPKCKRREYMKDWMARNKERVSSYYRGRREPDMRRGRVRDQHKERARKIAWRAVRSGELVPQPCEGCGLSPDEKMADGRRKVQAHHDDYEAPLEVRWLCQVCHGREHRDHQLGKEEP